jgi:hypothetical protein
MLSKTLLALATAATAALAAPGPLAAPKPAGGNSNSSSPPPAYIPQSDFDFQSLNLALNQEWIELDLFHYGLARFSVEEFEAHGINAEQRHLIEFMANQEVGHSTLLSNILQGKGARQCTYSYDFNTVPEFIQFCAILTRFGESGVYGFLPALDSRPAAQLLLQSISTEARQQMAFRQLAGAFPMPVWFEAGISQSMAWGLLSPYLVSCPAENPRIEWNIAPPLHVVQPANLTAPGIPSALSTNRTAFITPGSTQIEVSYELPGANVSYNGSYVTALGKNVTQTDNLTCVFIAQLNATNVPFVRTGNQSGTCLVPQGSLFDESNSIVNGSNFLLLVEREIYVTPYNLSLLDDITVAGPAVVLYG